MLSFKQFMGEVLDMTARRKLALKMKKNKTRIALGRKRAERKLASKDVLQKRARRQAYKAMVSKLTKGADKGEMSVARKKEIEKRLQKPAVQNRIDRQARKLMKTVRRQEIDRKRAKRQGGANK